MPCCSLYITLDYGLSVYQLVKLRLQWPPTVPSDGQPMGVRLLRTSL